MSNRLWPGLLVATILLSVAGLGTHQNALSSFRSDFAGRPVPTVRSTGKPLARAVYLVVIDGLGYRTAFSREMPFLGKLRDQAAWGLMTVDPPTYSRPGYARLLTGAPAELTALTMNDQRRPAPVPTIFGLASGSGLRAAASAHVWVRDLAGDEPAGRTGRVAGRQIQRGYYYAGDDEPDGRVFAAARDLVRQYDPALLLVLPMSLDAAGHSAGTSSAAYRESAAAVDAALADWHHSLPARDGILIVTGD
ncbi:MAG: alkaline phosphatase family protein, partial [Bacteroidota bacterium]